MSFTQYPEQAKFINNLSAYISMGSNLGDPIFNLENALQKIAQYPKASIGAVSNIYQTEPQGDKEQAWFCNQVIRLEYADFDLGTDFSFDANQEAHNLLEFLLNIENEMGRVRDINRPFGPRIIDLDILLFGNHQIESKQLTIPHQRMEQRAFILIPLQEIIKDVYGYNQMTIQDALEKLHYEVNQGKIYQ